MKFATRLLVFVLALVVDGSRILAIPGVESVPLLFVALSVGYALRSDVLTGGVWGFGGGLALGLLYADASIGARVMGGLLAGCVPAAMRKLLFWRRWPGQAALGAAGGLLFEATMVTVAAVRGDVATFSPFLIPRIGLTAALTGAACPLLARFVERLERLN